MSVQLILYPQNKATADEFLVNGVNFTGLSATTLYNTTASIPSQDAIINSPAITSNTWFRYNTTGGVWGTIAPPIMAANNLLFFFNVSVGRSGIYQKLSGLTVGQSYTVTVSISAAAVGTLTFETYTGSLLQSTTSASSNTTQIITVFVANSASDTILIEYQSVSALLNINDISVREGNLTPSATYEGQVIVDLYEDEDIPLTLSVDNFKNVAEKVQSYSKSFNLPATKRNNQIFTNIFEVTMIQDVFSFNPYMQTLCVLKQNGFILFQGYLRLIDIQDKEDEISYNVNLYSEVIALKDVLENKTFQDMGFNELEHEYTITEIQATWTGAPTWSNSSTSGFRDADTLKYPFADWNHQMIVSSGSLGGTAGNPELTLLEQAFRPFINIKYLLNRIFADTDFTWTSTIFDSADFGKLYMDFNWGADVNGAAPLRDDFIKRQSDLTAHTIAQSPSWTNIKVNIAGAAPSGSTALWDNTAFKFTSDVSNLTCEGTYRIQLMNKPFPNVDDWSTTMRICKFNAQGVILETLHQEDIVIAVGGSGAISGSFSTVLQANEYIQMAARTYNSDNDIEMSDSTTSFLNITYQNVLTQVFSLLNTARGDLSQWEVLKGIMTMFNLISLPDKDNPNNITFEPYNDIFITASDIVTHDWTDKIDVSEVKLTPLTDLNKKTIFKFVEDEDDYVFGIYKNSVGGHLYGSKIYDASGLTLLQGTDEIIAEPFAATIVKPLMTQFPNFITPAIYAMSSGASEGFENAPRIMYDNGVINTGVTYYIPAQNGGSAIPAETDILQFSHLTELNPTIVGTRDFHFGECQLIQPVGATVPDNLFNLYWLPYYNELYNSNTRTMSLKVALNTSDINTFKMNDRVFIKNRTYRVNKIDYKPNDLATVEFILIQ